MKITVVLVGLGLAIALVISFGRQWRRLLAPLAALGAGFAVTAGAAVAIGGSAMLTQSSQASDMVSIGSPWRAIRSLIHLAVSGTAATDLVKYGAVVLAVVLAVLLIRGLPGIIPGPLGNAADPAGRGSGYPAAGVAFALVMAWLFAWPYVLPWYDALGWALLPLVPLVSEPVAEAVGWLLLARTTALGFGYLPARTSHALLPSGLRWLQPVIRHGITPAVLAVAMVWLVVLMVRSGRLRRLGTRGSGARQDAGAGDGARAAGDGARAAGQAPAASEAAARERRS